MRKGQGTISKLIYDDALYQEIRSPIKRVDALLADLQAGNGSAGKLLKDPALYDEAKASLAEIRGLLGDLNAGKGTAGKLLKDDVLHKRLEELVAKFNGTIDKINCRTGHAGTVGGQPAVVRLAQRRHARIPVAGQGYAGQSQEVSHHPAATVLTPRKQLVVNADDFGFTPDVNAGIVEAHRDGILTATTLMANGDAFDDAVRLARETPDAGHRVSPGADRRTFAVDRAGVSGHRCRNWWRRWRSAGFAYTMSWRPRSGASPTRVSSPPTWTPTSTRTWRLRYSMLWRAWPRSSAYDGCGGPSIFRCTRSRQGVPRMKRLTSDALGLMRRRFHRVLAKHGCRTTDHFAGFQITGRFRTQELVELMAVIPRGQHGADGSSRTLRPRPARGAHAIEGEPAKRNWPRWWRRKFATAMLRHGIELVNYKGLGAA